MNNTHPQNAHLQSASLQSAAHQSTQPKQLLAQTHRVVQCDIPVENDHNSKYRNHQPAEKAQRSRWQQLLQNLKKMLLPALLTIGTLLIPQTQAADVSISVHGQIQPGVYGQINVGQPAVRVYHQPVYHQPVYQQPVYREPVYVHREYAPQTVYVQTVLVQAPKKHRKHWKKYCHHYGACQQRVQFVEVDYRPRQYEKVYVYQDRDYGRREEKRHYHRGHD